MSNTETEPEKSSTTSSSTLETQTESKKPKQVRNIPFGKPGPKCRKMLQTDADERKTPSASETESNKTEKSEEEAASNNKEDVPQELKQMFGELDSSADSKQNEQSDTSKDPAKVTTENLLSVLEGDADSKTDETALTQPLLPPEMALTQPVPSASDTKPNGSADGTEPVKSKKYVYKLKSKSGKIIRYTSNTPITIKRPLINLTKMVNVEDNNKGTNETDIDSDNSTKENIKDNDASSDSNVTTWTAKKRGRPPLSQKKTPTVVSEDRHSSDAGDGKDSTPSYGMQTRKRQIKFLPDGRVVTPSKKGKTNDKKSDVETISSSDSDIETASEDDSSRKMNSVKKAKSPEKKVPVEKKVGGKIRKVFDFENYFREKTGQSPMRDNKEQVEKFTPTILQNKSAETVKNNTPAAATTTTPESTPQETSPQSAKKVTPVDPAQLLSSLIGVPITPNQLNVVKFKPKIIQERSSSALTPKKVTIDDDRFKKAMPGNDPFKNTPYKVVSKTTFQKILPKPSPVPERIPIVKKVMEHRILAGNTPSTYPAIAPKITPEYLINDTLAKFENFTDSKVVKTKGGPKKILKRKAVEDDAPKTVYDLLQHVFDQMPSWNLHVIPDTNHFCIAQISRGRMGIPILKKSIELNSDFFAKVYVHQLHCKRYDGIYDTESKILGLIRDIDALAA